MPKSRLLVIPHTAPTPILVTRGEALAKALAQDFDVYLLAWRPESFQQTPIVYRALSKLGSLFTRQRLEQRSDIKLIHTPLLYIRRPGTEVLRSLNTAIVNRIIRKFGIQIVFNELSLVNSRNVCVSHIIDIVDLPPHRELRRWAKQAERAAGITTVTRALSDELARYDMEAEVIGNGADIAHLRGADGTRLRQELGLDGRFVIGYIGNHADWSGLIFLLEVFKELREVIPEATLLIVGPGTDIPKAKAKTSTEGIADVIFTGPVPVANIPEYFKAIDVGVMPYKIDPHTDVCFPIKAIEYGAARKQLVATPLKGLRELNLPYVHLVEPDIKAWTTTIADTRYQAWQDEWDSTVNKYDWKSLGKKLAAYIRYRCKGRI